MSLTNIDQVNVSTFFGSPEGETLLQNGTGTWDQSSNAVTCGTFTEAMGFPQVGWICFLQFNYNGGNQDTFQGKVVSVGSTCVFEYVPYSPANAG